MGIQYLVRTPAVQHRNVGSNTHPVLNAPKLQILHIQWRRNTISFLRLVEQ